ncbi:hypothetical protein VTL71DRAFT_142 [Oculimacula yallundae]|uniref:Zn(2)-C6 fungal-type domain-containing protein n=1 Tax=Oculimacula yallundae TaxID=86028 RepID=A0ABR4CZA4_9HELO
MDTINNSVHLSQHPTTSPASASRKRATKARRTTRACDFCNRRSIRCKPSKDNISWCQNCVDFDIPCTYDRPAKRRGKKVPSTGLVTSPRQSDEHSTLLSPLSHEVTRLHHITADSSHHECPIATQRMGPDELVGFSLARESRDMVLTNRDKIANLVNVYFEVVYPIFPLFHKSTLLRKIEAKEYLHDQGLFAAVMSICALASARARDGALLPGRYNPAYFTSPAAETFCAAAKDVMPLDLASSRGIDYMRSCALLALFGVQLGKVEIMHQYLGVYHSLVALDGLHDEKNWPDDVGRIETEERRRLFWSMYTLEVYYSIVWGGVIRCRESQSRVSFPSEVDDEFLLEESMESRKSSMQTPLDNVRNALCWIHGWNFTTEMYRILEHAMDGLHKRREQTVGPFSPSDLFPRDSPPQSVVLEKVMVMYEDLPARFKESRNAVGETSEDIFGFQAANIIATIQLVRMVLFTAEESTVGQKCAIANELLDGFSRVPISFLRAISSPLLYHLAGIGSILGSVMVESPLSEADYRQVRSSLLGIADLLTRLENTISQNVGANSRLRHLIARIDKFMISQRRQEALRFPPPVRNYHSPDSHLPHQDIPMKLSHVVNQVDAGAIPAGTAQWSTSQNTGSFEMVPIDDTYGSFPDLGATDDQFQFQIPPELLEDWPWPFDMTQGFGGFGSELYKM